MAEKGLNQPHGSRRVCGICRHPHLVGTRCHVQEKPMPIQKTAAQMNAASRG